MKNKDIKILLGVVGVVGILTALGKQAQQIEGLSRWITILRLENDAYKYMVDGLVDDDLNVEEFNEKLQTKVEFMEMIKDI